MLAEPFSAERKASSLKKQLGQRFIYGRKEDRDRECAAGFDHHFVKPLDTAALSAVLASIAIGENTCRD